MIDIRSTNHLFAWPVLLQRTTSSTYACLSLLFLVFFSGCAVSKYRKAMDSASVRVNENSSIIETPLINSEYTMIGEGETVLLLHGAGGGYDQGMIMAEYLLGEGYKTVVPSRFGYLGTPMPQDSTITAQADAYASLLDELSIQDVAIVAASGGTLSALEFALRYPDRCQGVVLLSSNVKVHGDGKKVPGIVRLLFYNNYRYWWFSHRLKRTVLKSLGVTRRGYRNASEVEKMLYSDILKTMHPIEPRLTGSTKDWNDVRGTYEPTYGDISVPVLLIHCIDDKLSPISSSRYAAEKIPGAELVELPSGGHIWSGHLDEISAMVRTFIDTTCSMSEN